ncbi:protein-S-isoprenylcysteine O-methyltransferase Ste14 [Leifsonia sp. EB41]|uniref:methyltransferase family protein n=1 Tax=Leifsonia sp. EB41 TaxID=3156260 RepID=UPI003518227F
MGVSVAVPAVWGRAYFAMQAVAGAAWWAGVFASPLVRTATLGGLDPVAVAAADLPLFVAASALAAAGLRAAAIVATAWTVLVAVGLAVYASVTAEAGWGVLLMLAAAGCSLLSLSAVLLQRLPAEWIVRGPFRFRPAARGRTPGALLLGTLGQIAVFWSFFLVVLPLVIAFLEGRWGLSIALSPPVTALGAVLLVAASALGLWSAATMATLGGGTPLPMAMAHRLVVAGPYRWVRNPMALAGIAQGLAVGLLLHSWLVVGYAILGSLIWNALVRPFEEADLEERFGDAFRAYRAQVRCWLPRPTPWSAPAPD